VRKSTRCYATREQIETAYPQMPEFLDRKHAFDPDKKFQSSWYRHMSTLFGDRPVGDKKMVDGRIMRAV